MVRVEREDGTFVAKKTPIKKEYTFMLQQEAEILCCLAHPNIVGYIQHLENPPLLYMEWIPETFLKFMERNTFSNSLFRDIFRQLIAGIIYYQSHGIIHYDLKPENILVQDNKQMKICDFGSAHVVGFDDAPPQSLTSMWYRAPEHLLGDFSLRFVSDVWALGVIALEFIRGDLFGVLAGQWEIEQQFNVFSLRGTPTEKTYPGVTDLDHYFKEIPQWPARNLRYTLQDIDVDDDIRDMLEESLEVNPDRRTSISLLHLS